MFLLSYAALRTAMWVVIKVILCFAVADVMVGVVHWLEDSYGSPSWPLIGAAIIAPNLVHHDKPRAFLANSYWKLVDVQATIALVGIAVTACLGWCSPELVLVLFLAVNANVFHAWAHRSRSENGRLIAFLHDVKLLQGRAHHGRHHGGKRNTTYCAITAWMDPVLDRLGFFRVMERMIKAVTGVGPRIDPAVAARLA